MSEKDEAQASATLGNYDLMRKALGDRIQGDADWITIANEVRRLREAAEKQVVNHPSHYNMGGPKGADGTAQYEAIKVIEDWSLGFKLGSALKYVLRGPHKADEEGDLRKAVWYLRRNAELPEPIAGPRTMNPEDVSAAWNLHPGLADVVYCIHKGKIVNSARAAMLIELYLATR